ncbi:peroxide stress protein YaaA [Haloprofundus marisrubri]|uniref:peroxide stress protein YaaA n=1 Tax=Haloprofundus marisrubri TaxID=1514971 RepID=UPI00138F757F|nr:peroxide stress protein YaaA [Haloprofundus marisrubri]
MSILLLQSCSDSKQEVAKRLPALNLYSGYFYKIIKKAIRENDLRADMDLRILSAEHGLLHPDTEILHYDRKMDTERAKQLQDDVVSELRELINEEGYNRVIVNMAKEYRTAIQGFDDELDVKVDYVCGDGIGYKGHVLKRVVRGDDSAFTVSS